MSSQFGNMLKVSVFGESHGKGIGVLVDGLPSGESVDIERLNAFMARRRPGADACSTARQEEDVPQIISGVYKGVTCGFPLCAVIENKDARSSDYSVFSDTPRPSHADYAGRLRYGASADLRGGGHFSGRLTAPLCIAGGIALQILERHGITVGAHLLKIAEVLDDAFDPVSPSPEMLLAPGKKAFPVLSDEKGRLMIWRIGEAKAESDSVGGVIECAAIGVPAGLGDPMFGGVENRLAAAVFGIPAVRGVEFGSGFAAAEMRGSQHNDPFRIKDGAVVTSTNNHGGILGGISTGMPVILRAAVKPTPSIAAEQETVSLSKGEKTMIKIKGRHDPCIAHRAVPVVEAVTACVILDMLIERNLL